MAPSNCQRRRVSEACLERLVMTDEDREPNRLHTGLFLLLCSSMTCRISRIASCWKAFPSDLKLKDAPTCRSPGTPWMLGAGWCVSENLPVGVRSRVHLVWHTTPGAVGGAEWGCTSGSELQANRFWSRPICRAQVFFFHFLPPDTPRRPNTQPLLARHFFGGPQQFASKLLQSFWVGVLQLGPAIKEIVDKSNRCPVEYTSPKTTKPCQISPRATARLKNTSAETLSWALCRSSLQFLRVASHFDRAGCTERHTRRRVIRVRG